MIHMSASKINLPHRFYKIAIVSLSISSLSLLICSILNVEISILKASVIETPSELFESTDNLLSGNLQKQTRQNQSNSEYLNVKQIKQVAKTQNATLIQYSIIYNDVTINGKKQSQESQLLTWVIQPNGEISMRLLNLQGKRCKERFSFLNLIHKNQGCLTQNLRLKELHQILIQPITDLLSKSEGRIIFIPQGDLFFVPFAALQNNDGQYLIEKYTISTAPSIQALDLLYQRKMKRNAEQSSIANRKNNEFLIIGNPTLPKIPSKPGENPSQLLPIPDAEREANTIARILKTQALTGNAASETVVVQKMPQAKIIHLATHAVEFNGTNTIALASSNQDDGWLSIEEIQNLNLQADLVVLRAGKTALGKITSDGVIGLPRAFLAAGADSVIASLWVVDDMAMTFLMTKFYENLSKSPDKAGALRQAILETMKKYPNPQDWGGFTSIGLL